MKWEDDALKVLKKVPFFIRPKVKKTVEEWLSKKGKEVVSLRDFQEAKKALVDKASEPEEGFSIEICMQCKNAITNSEKLLEEIEKFLEKERITEFLKSKIEGSLKYHNQFRVGIAECPNACSQIHIKDFALNGRILVGIKEELCSFCGLCVEICEEKAISLENKGPNIDERLCLGCGECIKVCTTSTLYERERGYRILIGGKLGRRPRLAEEIVSFGREEKVLKVLRKVIEVYKRENKKGERLGHIIERIGIEPFLPEN